MPLPPIVMAEEEEEEEEVETGRESDVDDAETAEKAGGSFSACRRDCTRLEVLLFLPMHFSKCGANLATATNFWQWTHASVAVPPSVDPEEVAGRRHASLPNTST